MRRLTRMLALALIFLLPAFSAAGQASTIEYGQTITGEITNSRFEVEYTFSGSAGDVIVVQMSRTTTTGGLENPEIVLLDSQNELLASTARSFAYARAVLYAELPASGSYVILATRRDGRSGTSVGEFELSLLRPEVISLAKSVNGTISSEGESQYYVVVPEKEFEISYQKTDGDMFPQVVIGTLDPSTGGLSQAAVASGGALTKASFGVFEGGMPYVVVISRAPFDFSFDEVTADYILMVVPST